MPHKLKRPLTGKFDEALTLATHLHREQARKGTQIPYIAHILAVTALVLEYGGTEIQAVAALLHDVVEDCGGRPVLAKIETQFGREVAAIVESCSDSLDEGPKRDWKQRKEEYIQHLRDCPKENLIVTAADKLHNLSAIQRDLQSEGTALWSRFNATSEQLGWYYRSVTEILERRLQNPIVGRLRETLEEVWPESKHESRMDSKSAGGRNA